MMWAGILIAVLGCYLLKLTGLSIPERVLARPSLQRVAALLPVALLCALAALTTFSEGRDFDIDARAPGLVVAVIAIALRAPFLVTVGAAALTTALIRHFF